jgi:hypothetical protein
LADEVEDDAAGEQCKKRGDTAASEKDFVVQDDSPRLVVAFAFG